MSGLTSMCLGFDADGVILDSETNCWRSSEDILALFGPKPSIRSRADHNHLFGRDAQARIAGPDHATLRSLHRLLMRTRAESVTLHRDVLSIVAQLTSKPIIFTAAYADGIARALGKESEYFDRIVGCESGPKDKLLAQAAAHGLKWFVTDTRRDIERCHACGLQSIAVGWGYDHRSDLMAATPNVFVNNPQQLASILAELSLLKPMEV